VIAEGYYLGERVEIVVTGDTWPTVGVGWCLARMAADPRATQRGRKAERRLWRMWLPQIRTEPWGEKIAWPV
jgi:hypothetical protein